MFCTVENVRNHQWWFVIQACLLMLHLFTLQRSTWKSCQIIRSSKVAAPCLAQLLLHESLALERGESCRFPSMTFTPWKTCKFFVSTHGKPSVGIQEPFMLPLQWEFIWIHQIRLHNKSWFAPDHFNLTGAKLQYTFASIWTSKLASPWQEPNGDALEPHLVSLKLLLLKGSKPIGRSHQPL